MDKDHKDQFSPPVFEDDDKDTTDAGPIGYDSIQPVPRDPHSSVSVHASHSAGSLLMSPPTFYKTAGEVVMRFTARPPRRPDGTYYTHEGVQMDDSEVFVFEAEGASAAVKHFFFNELQSSSASAKDSIDAGGEYGGKQYSDDDVDLPPQPHLGVTSKQKNGTERIEQRATSDLEDEFHYKMSYPERGCFIIFNHYTFDYYNENKNKDDHLKVRKGTNKDARNLENIFKQLGFEYVRVINNATRLEIIQWIDWLSVADHSQYDCFGCAILTHGGDRDILYARDAEMNLKDFTRPFGADRCPSLAGKPKLFFIQACRGVNFDDGGKVPVQPLVEADFTDGAEPASSEDAVDGSMERALTIPAEADFLIANSTVPEYYSWRNESNGSFFVQSLCAILHRYGDSMELLRMMTRVNRMVAYDFESSTNDKSSNKKKQIPSIATRLTAEVFFEPKHREQTGIQATCSPPAVSQTVTQYQSSVSRCTVREGYSSDETRVSTTTEISVENTTQRYGIGQPPAFFPQSSPSPPSLPPKKKKFYPDPKVSSSVRPKVPKQDTRTPRSSPNPDVDRFVPPSMVTGPPVENPPARASVSPEDSANQGELHAANSTRYDVALVVPSDGERFIPQRRKMVEGIGNTGSPEDQAFYQSPAEPQSSNVLRANPGNRQTSQRRSCPESRRFVTQISNKFIEVPGRKPTKKSYEESDL